MQAGGFISTLHMTNDIHAYISSYGILFFIYTEESFAD